MFLKYLFSPSNLQNIHPNPKSLTDYNKLNYSEGNSNGQRWFTISKGITANIEPINFDETPF